MKLIGMVAAAKLEPTGFGMRLAVRHAAGHSIALVQFVEQYKAALLSGIDAASLQSRFNDSTAVRLPKHGYRALSTMTLFCVPKQFRQRWLFR